MIGTFDLEKRVAELEQWAGAAEERESALSCMVTELERRVADLQGLHGMNADGTFPANDHQPAQEPVHMTGTTPDGRTITAVANLAPRQPALEPLLEEVQPIVHWAATYTDNPAIKKLADAWLKKLEARDE